ncbi:hypothetical protein [Microbacterium sp. cf332]|uniref:hypothetical protein n=1 Tax=Microbacterium sp. cf332 TaxID=1761804 RepID=UPI000890389F|nr:hypothetical protein [Microbacterium sp. cf332]SDQ18005.1 hypothetical protein SAMN04487847_0761 [Microbacterium sp. cf332]
MFVRRDHAVAALITAAVLLTGCGSPAAPPVSSPVLSSPSPSDDDAAAFEAAEATYRAYVDALNAVDLSDPSTFEPVFALTTGEVNEADRNGLSSFHWQGARVYGASRISLVEPIAVVEQTQVELAVCLDVSAVDVRASNGESLVSPERVPVQSLLVIIDRAFDAHPVVTRIIGREGAPGC